MEEITERRVPRVACLFPLFEIVLSFTSLPNNYIVIHKIGPEAHE